MTFTQSARSIFEDTFRPAELMLNVFRLLEHDDVQSDGLIVTQLRELIGAQKDEELMLITNELFMGMIRERANLPRQALRKSALCSLLRQSVVVACTAMETYLLTVLEKNLPYVIAARGKDFMPHNKELREYFKTMTFSLDEILRLLQAEDAPQYIADKLIRFSTFKYITGDRGFNTVGLLLTVDNPMEQIAAHLGDQSERLGAILKETEKRRNDIVHRADRSQKNPEAGMQEITYVWAKQSVDSINHACLALDDLVEIRMKALREELNRRSQEASELMVALDPYPAIPG